MKKICISRNGYKKLKKPKTSYIFDKALAFLLFMVSVAVIMKKYLKKKNQLRY